MMEFSPMAWQPHQELWTLECLNYERSIVLGMSIHSTSASYSSALNSYLMFCKSHGLPIKPMSQTLSYYTKFQSFHINPKYVNSYLLGICNQLEPYFPNVCQNRKSALVNQTLAGTKCYHSTPTKQKSPLPVVNLLTVAEDLTLSTIHDNLLFNAQLNTGFTGPLHLGEMTWPDHVALRDYKKVTMQFSMEWTTDSYSFWLPTHKTDTTFKGNWIVVKKITGTPDPHPIMQNYTKSHDTLFPFHPQLWLRSNGSIPLRSWFIKHLWHYFSAHIAGQSLRAGGATTMAEMGVEPQLIKGARRWKSKFLIYTHAFRLDYYLYYSFPTYFHLTCLSHRLCSTYRTTKHKTNYYIQFCHFSHSVQIFLGLPRLPSQEAAFRLTLCSPPWANAKREVVISQA